MMRHRPDGLYAAFDLGTFSVKAAIVERRQGRDVLLVIDEERLRPPAEFAGEAPYRDHLIQAIRTLAARLPIKDCLEIAGLFNSRELQTKIAELPAQVQLDQIEGILQFEGRKLLSPNFKQEPFILGYRILRDTPPTVLMTCVPQSLLIKFAELFEAAGVTLSGAYSEVFASFALRSLEEAGAIPTLAFANVGHISTHLTIFAAGELKFYRHIPAGMSEIQTMAAAQDLDVYYQKIRFSFDYFRAVSKLGQIDEIRFFGGGTAQGEFLDHAREYFAPTRTALPDVSSRLDITPVMKSAGEPGKQLLPHVPAIGTLLAHLDREGASGDLLGRLLERRREASLARLTTAIPLAGGGIGLVLILAAALFLRSGASAELGEARNKTGIVRATVDQLRLKQAGSRTAAGALADRMSPPERQALEPLLAPHPAPAELLFRVARSRPDGIALNRIRLTSLTDSSQEETEEEMPSTPGDEIGYTAESGPVAASPQPQPGFTGSGQAQGQEPNEELRGRLLEIRGTCTTPDALAGFSAALIRNGALSRIRSIKSKFNGSGGDRSKFVLKGELP